MLTKKRIAIMIAGLMVGAIALFGAVTYINDQQEIMSIMAGPAESTPDQRRANFKAQDNALSGSEKRYSSFAAAKANLPPVLANMKLPDFTKFRGKSPKTAAATENLFGVVLLRTTDDTNSAPGMLMALFTSKLSQKDKDEGIDPSQAIRFTVEPDADEYDYDAFMEQEAKAVADGMSRADTEWFLTEVNGNTAIGVEPGYNVFGSEKRERSGSIIWREGGYSYHIAGSPGPDGTSVAMMMEIAEEVAQSEPAQ